MERGLCYWGHDQSRARLHDDGPSGERDRVRALPQRRGGRSGVRRPAGQVRGVPLQRGGGLPLPDVVLLGPATQRLGLGSRARVVVWDGRRGRSYVKREREEKRKCPHAGPTQHPGRAAPWGGDHDPDTCAPLRVIRALLLDVLAIDDIVIIPPVRSTYLMCEHLRAGDLRSAHFFS